MKILQKSKDLFGIENHNVEIPNKIVQNIAQHHCANSGQNLDTIYYGYEVKGSI